MIEGQTETITGDEMIRQPNQSISGIDGRPGCDDCEPDAVTCDECHCQADPVLTAIREMELHPDRANNGWANHIRTAYLDFKVAHDSWIERANRALDDEFEDALDLARRLYVSQSSDGGEFYRVIEAWWKDDVIDARDVSMLIGFTNAHNADRAADKQRIAELTGELNVSRAANESLRERIARLEARLDDTIAVSQKRGRVIAELEDQLKKARGDA